MSSNLRRLFGALFLSSGTALLIYIISDVSLLAAAGLSLVVVTFTGVLIWRKTVESDRSKLRRAVKVGIISGLLATGVYDLSRYLIIEVAGFTYWPFDIFTIFGQALVGAGYHGTWVTVAGVSYHFANGVGFAIAYTIWLGHKGVWAGIGWAMALEVLMVTIYPGWLGLKALDEFVQVSILGHFAYGSVLGCAARYLFLRNVRKSNVLS